LIIAAISVFWVEDKIHDEVVKTSGN